MTQLKPKFTKGLSTFCGQAMLEKTEKGTVLYSFDKKVGLIDKEGKCFLFVRNIKNKNQLVHIKEWLKQNCLEIGNKKFLFEKYGKEMM